MASVLTHNLGNIDKITFFMEEARRMGVPVLGPDVNESEIHFSVNKSGQIRFGMGAIKGVGENAAQAIISERKENGQYKSVFDLVRRVNLRAASKKTLENLVFGGGLDSFTNLHRATYFKNEGEGTSTFLEKIIRFGQAHQDGKNSSQVSLFDAMGDDGGIEMPEPTVPFVEEWGRMEKLKAEKDAIGIYLSGHPLDDYKVEMTNFCKHKVSELKDLPKWRGHELIVGGMITSVQHKMTKTGKPFGTFFLEDYNESHEFALFGNDYVEFKKYILTAGLFVLIKGTVQERFGQEGNLEFKVKNMELLSEILEKRVKSFTIQLPLTALSDELITRVQTIVAKYPGGANGAQLKFTVMDTAENMKVELPSRKMRVKADNELFRELDTVVPEANWKLN
jgi:DNA polymerase-3 subunit alpha